MILSSLHPMQDSSQAAMATVIESVKCECCELREDCTRGYIVGVKADFGGRWLCGLCSEVVREEGRKRGGGRLEEALQDHMSFCGRCRRKDPAFRVADGMRQMLLRRRSSDSLSDHSAWCTGDSALPPCKSVLKKT